MVRPCRSRLSDAKAAGTARRGPSTVASLCLLALVGAAGAAGGAPPVAGDARSGVLWVRPGAGASAVWIDGPDSAVSCLAWPGGLLLVARGAPRLAGPGGAIGLAYGAGRRGFTQGRHLLFSPGRYAVREPVLLTDGSLHAFISRGELEIADDSLIVRADVARRDEGRSGLLLALGMLVIVGVLTVRGRVLARQA